MNAWTWGLVGWWWGAGMGCTLATLPYALRVSRQSLTTAALVPLLLLSSLLGPLNFLVKSRADGRFGWVWEAFDDEE